MIADTEEELHKMADIIGIKRKWFQKDASTPHYDICKEKRKTAIRYGAIELDRRKFVGIIKKIRRR